MLRTYSMTDKVNYVTADGLEKLKAELKDLKTVKQRELADRSYCRSRSCSKT
jgi:hypothetical protein